MFGNGQLGLVARRKHPDLDEQVVAVGDDDFGLQAIGAAPRGVTAIASTLATRASASKEMSLVFMVGTAD